MLHNGLLQAKRFHPPAKGSLAHQYTGTFSLVDMASVLWAIRRQKFNCWWALRFFINNVTAVDVRIIIVQIGHTYQIECTHN